MRNMFLVVTLLMCSCATKEIAENEGNEQSQEKVNVCSRPLELILGEFEGKGITFVQNEDNSYTTATVSAEWKDEFFILGAPSIIYHYQLILKSINNQTDFEIEFISKSFPHPSDEHNDYEVKENQYKALPVSNYLADYKNVKKEICDNLKKGKETHVEFISKQCENGIVSACKFLEKNK